MLREVAGPAGLAGMLRCVSPPHLKEALQIGSAAGAVAVHAGGGGGQDGLHMSLLGQVLQGACPNGEPEQHHSLVSKPTKAPFGLQSALCVRAGSSQQPDPRTRPCTTQHRTVACGTAQVVSQSLVVRHAYSTLLQQSRAGQDRTGQNGSTPQSSSAVQQQQW